MTTRYENPPGKPATENEMPLYEEILKAAAEEAAEAATDAFGPGAEPDAEMAYEFICGVWEDTDEPAAAYLPTDMPAEFAAAYAAALGR